MHTPNDEIKTKTFLSFSDVDGEGSCFFYNAESKIPYQQFSICLIYIMEL